MDGGKRRGFALSVLYSLERAGLRLDHAGLQKAYPAVDSWWVQRGEAVEGPHTLRETLDFLLNGDAPLHIVHHSAAGDEPVPWKRLSYSPIWLNRGRSRLYIIGFWMTLAFVGFALCQGLTPFAFRFVAGILYWLIIGAILVGNALRSRRSASGSPPAVSIYRSEQDGPDNERDAIDTKTLHSFL